MCVAMCVCSLPRIEDGTGQGRELRWRGLEGRKGPEGTMERRARCCGKRCLLLHCLRLNVCWRWAGKRTLLVFHSRLTFLTLWFSPSQRNRLVSWT